MNYSTTLDYNRQNEKIQKAIASSIEKEFPLETKNRVLKIENISLKDPIDLDDIPTIKDLKLKRGSYNTHLYGKATLIDKKTGEILDTVENLKLGNIPKMTKWYSMIIDGNEYQTVNQLRLKSGIYTRIKNNGDLESRFNLEKGFNFTMILPPDRGIVFLVTRNAQYRLYNILNALGVDDEKIINSWGKEIFDKNKKGSLNTQQADILQLYNELTHSKETDYIKAINGIKTYFDSTKVSPETTKITLGTSYEKVTPETLLAASKKLINVMRGEDKPDERESLIFKDLYGVEDLVTQYFDKNKETLTNKIKYRMDKKDSIRDIISSSIYSKPIKSFFTQSDLASTSEQTNPVQIVENAQKVTFMGTGGIGSRHAITKEVRDLHPTHLNFIDSLATPESSKAGVNLELTRDTIKEKNTIKTAIRMPNGDRKFVSPSEFYDLKIGFGDQYALVNKKPRAISSEVKAAHKGKTLMLPAKEIDAWMFSPSNMFSYATNLIPYMQHNSGNRLAMAHRMLGQAIPITEREAPYIQTKWKGDESFQKIIGNFINPKPGASGTVTKVDDKYVHINLDKPNEKGEKNIKIGLFNNFPLNQESFIHNEVKVKPGDRVTPNKFLAENNFTKDGVLALGANVNVAYMPWKGLTFEDSAVVSESFAKKFSSEKIIKKNIYLHKDFDELNLSKFRLIFPDVLTNENAKKLDNLGIIKPGQIIEPGEKLAVYLSKIDLSDEEKILKQMNRALASPYQKKILEWDEENPGEILYVNHNNKNIDIHIKVKSAAVVGDKFSGLYGNKAIISEIVPDSKMPHTKDGERMDMIFSPITVPGRMNIGQIAEAAAGKLIHKTNKKSRVIDNFVDKDQMLKIEKELKENKIPIEETLLDGKDGKPFEHQIFWGKPYILKLRHVVDHKLKSRNTGSYDINLQPSRGKDSGQTMGSMEVMSMLSHGAKCFTGNVLIETSEGAIPLWKIFNENKEWFVKSYNKQTNKLEYKKIINKFKSKSSFDNLIKVTINNNNTIYSTRGHEFYNINTEREAVGNVNEVLIENKDNTSLEQKQIILGSYLGDGYITKSGGIQIVHSIKQEKYLKFKAELLNLKCDYNIKRIGGYKDNSYYSRTKPKSLVFGKFIRQIGYINNIKSIPKYLYDNLDALGLSIFYQDDGSYTEHQRSKTIRLASYNFTKDENKKLKKTIKKITGASFNVRKTKDGYYYLVCSKKDDRNLFFNSIKKYMHPSMMYKLPKNLRSDNLPNITNNISPLIEAPINKNAYKVSPSQKNIKFKWVYNIEVEDNHNYILKAGYLVGNSNLYEATALKSQQNDEYWRALQLGLPTPTPKHNFAFDKFQAYLKQSGVNVEKEGDNLTLMPMTDKEVDKISNGPVTDGGQMLIAKNLKEIKGGIFDPEIFGGNSGKKWGHLELVEKIPNPIMEEAIIKVLDLTQPKFNAIISEKETLNGKTGFKAIEDALKKIDPKKEIPKLKKELDLAPPQKINVINKKIRYLENLEKLGLSPVDYMIKKVPVLPPIYRPIYPLPSGDLMVSPINKHYRDVSLINDAIKKQREIKLNEESNKNAKIELYNSVKALQGLIEPTTYSKEKYEGAIKTLAGSSPKQGFIHDKLFSKKQDMSARSTVGLDPSLGIDEVGLPDEMTKTLFKPFVMKKLVESGIKAVDANKHVLEWTPLADKTLDIIIKERPVLLNRAPTLHKHGIQAFKAKRVPGKTIKTNPLINAGFNLDFDGDCLLADIQVVVDFKGSTFEKLIISDLNLDFDKFIHYIISRGINLTKRQKMILKESYINYVNTKTKTSHNIHISEIPYYENKITKETENIIEYEVPDFIKVFAVENGKQTLKTVTRFSIHKNLKMFKVTTGSKREVIASSDHSLICYDPVKEKLNKFKPEKAIGLLTPLPLSLDLTNNTNKKAEEGWFVGCIVGDGWIDRLQPGKQKNANKMMLSNSDKNIIEASQRFLNNKGYSITNTHDFNGHTCTSTKITWSDKSQASYFRKEIGSGAANKHLPRNFLNTSENYRFGLLSGLIDTDGSICIVKAVAKNKPQYIASYATISKELHYQIQQLCASLGIRTSVNIYEKNEHPVYHITFYMNDLVKYKNKFNLKSNKKRNSLNSAFVSVDRKSIVPISYKLANTIQKKLDNKATPVLYAQISKAKKTGTISRKLAKELCSMFRLKEESFKVWKKEVVNNNNLTWDIIKSIEPSSETVGYDLTVPGPYTFMTSNLLLVQDTMAVHVPIGGDAVNEAWGMLPSKNIFKHGDNAVVHELSQEYQFGLYWLTKDGKDTGKTFNSLLEAKKANLHYNDLFTLKGRKTSIGKEMVNSTIPIKYRNYKDPFTKKVVKDLLTTIAKESPNDFPNVINSFKDLGNRYAHYRSSTISLSDFTKPRTYRDNILKEYQKKVDATKDKDKKIQLWLEATDKVIEAQNKEYSGKNNIYEWVESGGLSGSKAPNVNQILSMPGVISDVKGNPIEVPVLKSFGEGIDSADYWNTLYGVRKGTIDTSISTSGPGALSKALMGNVWNVVIAEEDCKTKKFLELEIKDNEKDIIDRTLAETIPGVGHRNDIIDEKIYNKLKTLKIKNIKVRSPLTCESTNGICQFCYGVLPTGQFPEIGYNVGIADAQALGEKSTQLVLRTKHTGAAFSGGKKEHKTIGSFDRLVQLLEVPEIVPNKAVLSPVSGVITEIKPDALGGWNLKINSKKINVPSGRELVVKNGQFINKGDRLSTGEIKPQELSNLKGHQKAQLQIIDELDDIYQKDYHKKTFETVIRSISNNAYIEETPDKSEYLRGDVSTIQNIDRINKERKAQNLKPIKYKPYFKSIQVLPQDKEDWLSRVATNRIIQSIKESAATGAASNIHGNDPIPSYLTGTEFAKKFDPEKGHFY